MSATATAVAICLCAPGLSGCGRSDTTNSADSTMGAPVADAGATPPAAPAPVPAIVATAFDPAKIGPTRLWTGKAITDGFGIACPFSADAGGRPDVAGVALGMTLEAAVSNLACRYPEAQFTTSNANRNPYSALNGSTYGMVVAFKPTDGRAYETIDLFLSGPRRDEKVVGVWRAVYYQPQNAPLTDKIAAQMGEKYGAFDRPTERFGVNPRGAWTNVKTADGQRVAQDGKFYLVCLQAINFGQLNYAPDSLIDAATKANCGDTVAFRIGTTAGVGLAGDFITFLFNPTYGKAQSALSTAQAQDDRAMRDAETQREASQRQGPTL